MTLANEVWEVYMGLQILILVTYGLIYSDERFELHAQRKLNNFDTRSYIFFFYQTI